MWKMLHPGYVGFETGTLVINESFRRAWRHRVCHEPEDIHRAGRESIGAIYDDSRANGEILLDRLVSAIESDQRAIKVDILHIETHPSGVRIGVVSVCLGLDLMVIQEHNGKWRSFAFTGSLVTPAHKAVGVRSSSTPETDQVQPESKRRRAQRG